MHNYSSIVERWKFSLNCLCNLPQCNGWFYLLLERGEKKKIGNNPMRLNDNIDKLDKMKAKNQVFEHDCFSVEIQMVRQKIAAVHLSRTARGHLFHIFQQMNKDQVTISCEHILLSIQTFSRSFVRWFVYLSASRPFHTVQTKQKRNKQMINLDWAYNWNKADKNPNNQKQRTKLW